MDEQGRFNQEWAGQTVISPLGFVVTAILGLAMLMLPRRLALVPVCIMACFVAPGQRLIILGCNFQLLRLLVLIGWGRVLARGEFRGINWGWIDWLMAAWVVVGVVTFTVLNNSSEAFVWRLGNMYDSAGMYLFCRCLIRNFDDLDILVTAFAVLSIPVAIAFIVEHLTGRNAFAVFGGVPAITAVREGRLRCQGAFANPIVAGSFWASLLPPIFARWWCPGASRFLVVAAIACSLAVIVMCASSTPVVAVGCCVLGGLMFRFRRRMRAVWWSLVLALLGLHLVMKAPVWSLLARIDLAGGSTGWYRYILVDSAIRHIGEWWMVGEQSMATWDSLLAYTEDVCNEFVLQGMRGGLITLALFCAILVLCYRRVGLLWRGVGRDPYRVILAWSLGTALFCHTVTFFGLSYFGQMTVSLYLLLAVVAALEPRRQGAAGAGGYGSGRWRAPGLRRSTAPAREAASPPAPKRSMQPRRAQPRR